MSTNDVEGDGVDARVLAAAWGDTSQRAYTHNDKVKPVPHNLHPTSETKGSDVIRRPESAQVTPSDQSKSTVPKDTKTIPLPGRKTTPHEAPRSLPPAEATDTAKMPPVGLKIRTASLPAPESITSGILDSAYSPHRRDTPLTRSQSFANVIRYTQSAVRLQLELEAAQANVERWKTTQLSPEYSRASQATRTMLDGRRSMYAQEVAKISQRLNEAIKAISETPNLSEHWKFTPEVDEKQLKFYINQLKEWIRELQVFSRLDSPTPKMKTPQLQDRFQETWQQIEDSFAALEEISERIVEHMQFQNYTILDVDFIDPKAKVFLDEINAKEKEDPAKIIENLLAEADRVGDRLGAQAEPTANLIGKSYRDEQLINQAKAQLLENEKVQSQVSCSRISTLPKHLITSRFSVD